MDDVLRLCSESLKKKKNEYTYIYMLSFFVSFVQSFFYFYSYIIMLFIYLFLFLWSFRGFRVFQEFRLRLRFRIPTFHVFQLTYANGGKIIPITTIALMCSS